MKWITRERPKIDRLACSWLIRRFIDKEAEIIYVLFAEVMDKAAAQSVFAISQSTEQLLRKSFLPKLSVWGTTFARGSGFEADGTVKTWDGMGLSRYNYGAGLQFVICVGTAFQNPTQFFNSMLLLQLPDY